MEIVKINGKVYDVLVTGISEAFTILYDSNTGRTLAEGAKMVLSPIGTFFSHTVTFKRRKGKEREYDALYNFVSTPRSYGVPVEIVHGQETITYEAYVSNGARKVKEVDLVNNKVVWEELSVNIIPTKAQVLPE